MNICFSNTMPEGVIFGFICSLSKTALLVKKKKKKRTTAIGGVANEAKKRLPIGVYRLVRYTTVYFIMDKENHISRDNSVKNIYGMGTLS